MKMSNTLSKLYYNPIQGTSYSGAARLIEKAKQAGIPEKKVKKWLQNQDAYTKHRRVVRRFPRRRYTLLGIDDLWQADLADVSNLAQWNNGVKFWLVIIDCFSKFVWVKPLKSKSSTVVVNAIASILAETGRKPRNLNTDKGTEFVNVRAKSLFEKQGINFYTSQNPDTKACFAERVIRSLKERLHRMLTHKNTKSYIDLLQDLVSGYNSAKHRSIGMSPNEVDSDTEDDVRQMLSCATKKNKKSSLALKVGFHVRVAKERTAFHKGYNPVWTEEIFKIASVQDTSPPMFKIEDAAGETIAGSFYQQELQHVSPKRIFKIEKILRKRTKNGRKEVLVKWMGYPLSMSSWEPASEIKVIP